MCVSSFKEILCFLSLFFLVAYDGKLYIFGGYNNVIGLHFNDLHEFNPATCLWRCIKTRGIDSPVARRRQCCLVIGNRMYMFGGTSPTSTSIFQNRLNGIQDNDATRTRLYDQSDLYVFDFGNFSKYLITCK